MTMMKTALLLLLSPLSSRAFAPLTTQPYSSSTALNVGRKASFAPDYCKDYKDENDALHIPNRLAFTTAKWQDSEDAQDAFDILLEGGIPFVCCTPGKEDMLGTAILNEPDKLEPVVAMSYNARFKFGGESSVVSSIEASLEKLQVMEEIELLQTRPSRLSLGGVGALAAGIRTAIDDGYCVSGGSMDITSKGKLKAMRRQMEQRDETLTTNQFEFSLTDRKNEKMIQACKDMGVTPLIRHPLGKDMLASGIWTSEDPNGSTNEGPRFSLKVLEKYEPLHSMQYRIVEKVQARAGKGQGRQMKDYRDRRYEEKKSSGQITPAQVALNYIVAKGGVPLVDVYDEASAHELLGCLGWQLLDEEVRLLDEAAELSNM